MELSMWQEKVLKDDSAVNSLQMVENNRKRSVFVS